MTEVRALRKATGASNVGTVECLDVFAVAAEMTAGLPLEKASSVALASAVDRNACRVAKAIAAMQVAERCRESTMYECANEKVFQECASFGGDSV